MGVKFTSFDIGEGAAFIAGLSSSISMLESSATVALDKFKISREKLVAILIALAVEKKKGNIILF